MEFIESILKKERVKDDSEFERIILSIDNFTKFLDDFNRKRLALKVSSGDSLGFILSSEASKVIPAVADFGY